MGTSCALKRSLPQQSQTVALAPASSGVLAEVSEQIFKDRGPGQSAFLLLNENKDAFQWRLALADQARTSIDAQYFIWDSDETAVLLFERLLAAADRGVRVRILVDDMALNAKDKNLAALSRYPNVNLRIYNPGFVRRSRIGSLMEFLLYFKELNRRMHNKMFVVDNRFAIVGGRNIGNAYFGLSEKYNNRDLDVLVTGPVVPEVSSAFDKYWNQNLAVPGHRLSNKGGEVDVLKLREKARAELQARSDTLASYPIARKDWSTQIRRLPAMMESGTAHFLQDDPEAYDDNLPRLLDMIPEASPRSEHEVLIVSPYFIPGKEFLRGVKEVVERGVKVKFLTGSLGSNNHTVAHSHYKKYRRGILETGAELYEFRHNPSETVREDADVAPIKASFISLHAKTIVGDRERSFIGSLNLDPRSVVINTENGMLIESPDLSSRLAAEIDQLLLPENSWRVFLDDRKRLRWEGKEGVVKIQPARGFSQRIADFIFRLLPIESQL